MVEVNPRHECALRAITHARIRGGTNDLRTAIETEDAIVDEMIVGVGEENIANAIGRRRGITTGNVMKIRSRRNRGRMYVCTTTSHAYVDSSRGTNHQLKNRKSQISEIQDYWRGKRI
jgi:hypothetical protein